MQPSPPQSDDDITRGFSILMGNIGYLRQQVEAYNKRPLPATEEHMRDLIKNEKERPINVPAAQVVEHLMGKNEQLVKDFQTLYTQFLNTLDKQTKELTLGLGVQAASIKLAVKDVEKAVVVVDSATDKIPSSVPVKGDVWGFTNRMSFGGTVGASMLVGALLFWVWPSSKVSKADYERVLADAQQARRINEVVLAEGKFYQGQIANYKAKNPKTTDFPLYNPTKAVK